LQDLHLWKDVQILS